MSEAREGGQSLVPRLLAEIAHTLESGEDAPARIGRVLEILRSLIPYDRCALLDARAGFEAHLRVVPEAAPPQHDELAKRLKGFLRLLDDREQARRQEDHPALKARAAGSSHLALPLLSLEQVVGVLFVERDQGGIYDEESLSLLWVVAAQIANYLTTLCQQETAARALRDLGRAHSFQQLLVGVVSHDLRNPLSAILGGAGLLLRRSEDPRQIRTVERIISSARRATRIINDLLDVTRVRLGDGIPIGRKSIDLGQVLQDTVEEIREAHPGRDIELDAPESVLGEWDADRLAQVVTNLLANALHHGPSATKVKVALRVSPAEVEIEVYNRGPAIPPEILPLIFDPFKRGEQQLASGRATGKAEGLGLGLYIVHQVIAAHGGRVGAQSTDLDGTRFTVVLPR